MSKPMTVTQDIAHWVHQFKAEDLSDARVHKSRILLLDFLGCALAGSQCIEAQDGLALMQSGRIKVPGHDQTMDSTSAIMAWGTFGALLQWHDGYGRGGNHPSSSILPVLLHQSSDWGRMLLPMIIGYEVANRLAACTHPKQTILGSAPTSSMGAIGAAASLSRWQSLNPEITARALGLAGFWAPIAAFEGLRARGNGVPLHSGLASRAGWEAVIAAKAGLGASPTLLEGRDGPGLLQLLGANSEFNLSTKYWCGDTLDQVFLKPFPGCRHVHPAVEAALGLRQTLGNNLSELKRIEIASYELAISFKSQPQTTFELYDCLMSLPWCVALALNDGIPTLQKIKSNRDRSEIAKIMNLMHFSIDPQHQKAYPRKLGATVRAHAFNGQIWEQDAVLSYSQSSLAYSPQGPFGPVLDEVGVIRKFLDLASDCWPQDHCEKVADDILNSKIIY